MQNKKTLRCLIAFLFIVILGISFVKENDSDNENLKSINYSIYIESSDEETEETEETTEVPVTTETSETDIPNDSVDNKADDRVNINTADKSLLTTLPMIGEKRADAIIAYRKEHGGFLQIRDIMNVSGIGKKIYNKIKEKIKV